ncbi:MAG: glutaconate CoA-transferase [Dethiobacter sp.]|jgi:glutaconate CoA-transferase subunit B|nr:glutaconate CoA-transferase [Dethiobacter sp.]
MEYNRMELMICLASRFLEDEKLVVVGTGAPCAAAMLAQSLYAPNLMIMFEAGGIGPLLPSMPISVGDSRTFYRALAASSMPEVMETCQRGMVDYTFLGGAQIDMYGNINSTMIGQNYDRPKVRFPGSGGANDLASFCWRVMMITVQDARRFTNNIDFVTSPGYLTGKGAREAAGLPPGSGPYKVITDLCVLGFDAQSKRMQVESIHPGISREHIIENTGFELLWSAELLASDPPTAAELKTLRDKVDPYRYIIGRS